MTIEAQKVIYNINSQYFWKWTNLEAVATRLKIFMGLALLVHFQKYWLLSFLGTGRATATTLLHPNFSPDKAKAAPLFLSKFSSWKKTLSFIPN